MHDLLEARDDPDHTSYDVISFIKKQQEGAHHVVSVSSSDWCALTAFAQPSGPSFTSTSRQDVVGPSICGTAGGGGVYFAGGRPTAPGCFGPLTTYGRPNAQIGCRKLRASHRVTMAPRSDSLWEGFAPPHPPNRLHL